MDQKEREAPAAAEEQPGQKAPPSKVGDLGKGSHEQTQGGPSAPSPPGYGDQ